MLSLLNLHQRGNKSPEEETSDQQSDESHIATTKHTPVRRSARRALIDEMHNQSNSSSKNNNAIMAEKGSIFMSLSKSKINEKERDNVENCAVERKRVLNLEDNYENENQNKTIDF